MKKEKHRKMHGNSAQSAMEYLMTYGWAILIIAVVLAVLFSLGITNPLFFAPKAVAGGCQVIRPSGAGTTDNINLAGTCDGAIPKFVAELNGASSSISTSTSELPLGSSPRSVFAWIYVTGSTSSYHVIYNYGARAWDNLAGLFIFNGYLLVGLYGPNGYTALSPSSNNWHFVGYVYNGGTSKPTVYLDAQSQVTGYLTFNTVLPTYDPSDIGKDTNGAYAEFFPGKIANLQVYDSALSASEVQALYQEGIGGAPIALQHIVGWWPLNGNANDYSGNNNDGVASNVIWDGNWWQTYTSH